MSRTDTQRDLILEDLLAGLEVTPMSALERHGCFRLAPRILELREMGYPIVTEMKTDGEKRWASYRTEQRKAAA